MGTLLKAGIPLIQSFDILAKSQTQLVLKWLIEDLKNRLKTATLFMKPWENTQYLMSCSVTSFLLEKKQASSSKCLN